MANIKYRARFRKISNSKECWQHALLTRTGIINPGYDLNGYCQVSEWERYIGKRDKNGVQIFEGDILNSQNDGSDGCDVWDYFDHVNLIVMWSEKNLCFTGLPDTNPGGMSVHDISRIEVLGNVYEHPELLAR